MPTSKQQGKASFTTLSLKSNLVSLIASEDKVKFHGNQQRRVQSSGPSDITSPVGWDSPCTEQSTRDSQVVSEVRVITLTTDRLLTTETVIPLLTENNFFFF